MVAIDVEVVSRACELMAAMTAGERPEARFEAVARHLNVPADELLVALEAEQLAVVRFRPLWECRPGEAVGRVFVALTLVGFERARAAVV